MFEDWARALAATDIASSDEVALRRMLAGSARLRAVLDSFDARAAAKLGEAAAVRSATRCTQQEADRAVERGRFIDALPEVGLALTGGEISGAHVDALARAAARTSTEAVATSPLLGLARAKPADAMAKQINDFVRREASDADLQARLQRQRSKRRASLFASDMGVLHVEWDDATFGEIRAAIDTETDRLYRLDGGRDGGNDVRTPQQRRADAVASLLLGGRSAGCAGPPAVRNQLVVVSQATGGAVIPGVGPLPTAEVERLACISDLWGLVFDGDGQPLWHGQRRRLASDDQWRALIARDGGCIGCGAGPSRCDAHHVHWHRNGGPTDIENLALVCKHHHHLIHEDGWQVRRDPSGSWALAPP